MKEEREYSSLLSSWQGAWISVNGNPDMYIFQGWDGSYYLLAYNYDKESERGSFSCHDIDSDEDGIFIRMGMKNYRMVSMDSPSTLHITGWGDYMKN